MIYQLDAEAAILNRNRLEQLLYQCKKASTGTAPSADFCKTKITELIDYLSQDRAFLFVFIENGCVWGFLWSCILKSTDDSKKMHILYLVVDEICRGRGIGKSLLDEVEKKAKSLDIHLMELNVSASNTGARALYENAEYTTERLTMVKQI